MRREHRSGLARASAAPACLRRTRAASRRVPPPRITIARAVVARSRSRGGAVSTERESRRLTAGIERRNSSETPVSARARPTRGRRRSRPMPNSASSNGPVGGRTSALNSALSQYGSSMWRSDPEWKRHRSRIPRHARAGTGPDRIIRRPPCAAVRRYRAFSSRFRRCADGTAYVIPLGCVSAASFVPLTKTMFTMPSTSPESGS